MCLQTKLHRMMHSLIRNILVLLFIMLTPSSVVLAEIPRKIHQIWIGDSVPLYLQDLSKTFQKIDGWQYNLWLLSEKELDNPFGTIHRLTLEQPEHSSEWVSFEQKYPLVSFFREEYLPLKLIRSQELRSSKNHKASLSDLMRYRIVFNEGGFYFDLKFELVNSSRLQALSTHTEWSFIAANEFSFAPHQNPYLSNGFFAASTHHPALKLMLEMVKILGKDIKNSGVDIFGPHFFLANLESWYRDDIRNRRQLQLLMPELIYPYIDWSAKNIYNGELLRPWGKDRCIMTDKDEIHPDFLMDGRAKVYEIHKHQQALIRYPCDQYPDSIAVDHFGYGSSWNSHDRENGNHL